MIKLLIADDHVMFRDGLRRVLEEDSHLEVIGEAKNSVEALAKSADLRPDVVILDLIMPPGRDAVETVGELKRRNPEVKILILTARSEDEYALRCLRAGADGYLTKINASAEAHPRHQQSLWWRQVHRRSSGSTSGRKHRSGPLSADRTAAFRIASFRSCE